MWESLSIQWQACVEEAWQAYRAGSLPIGAVVTDSSGQIIARGRNRINEKSAEIACLYNNPLAHAEVNALTALDYGKYDPPFSCILYTLVEPCPFCFGAFYMSGLRELRYATREPYSGSVNLFGKTPYLQRKPIRIIHFGHEGLETIVAALLIEPLLAAGLPQEHSVLAAYAQALPKAFHFGQLLAKSQQLQRLQKSQVEARIAINQLAELYAELPDG